MANIQHNSIINPALQKNILSTLGTLYIYILNITIINRGNKELRSSICANSIKLQRMNGVWPCHDCYIVTWLYIWVLCQNDMVQISNLLKKKHRKNSTDRLQHRLSYLAMAKNWLSRRVTHGIPGFMDLHPPQRWCFIGFEDRLGDYCPDFCDEKS